jgi:hypothetical protein
MSDTKRQLEESLFEAASNLPDPAERNAFPARACGEDRTLRERLEL